MVPVPAAAWWGYAEGNPTLVGIAVGLVVAAAIVYVVRRFWRS
jgi:multisubunit Na+/H+ antiporter MnhE subunit